MSKKGKADGQREGADNPLAQAGAGAGIEALASGAADAAGGGAGDSAGDGLGAGGVGAVGGDGAGTVTAEAGEVELAPGAIWSLQINGGEDAAKADGPMTQEEIDWHVWKGALETAFPGSRLLLTPALQFPLLRWGDDDESSPFIGAVYQNQAAQCAAKFFRNFPDAPGDAAVIHLRRTLKQDVFSELDPRRAALAMSLMRIALAAHAAFAAADRPPAPLEPSPTFGLGAREETDTDPFSPTAFSGR